MTDFDPSKTLTGRKATFEPYKTPVLISVDPSFCEKSNKNSEKGGVHYNQKYPTLTFLLGENIFYHRFQKFKEISQRRRFRGIPAICNQCSYRVTLAPVFTIDMSDPRFCSIENWKIMAPSRAPKYPIHTCISDPVSFPERLLFLTDSAIKTEKI